MRQQQIGKKLRGFLRPRRTTPKHAIPDELRDDLIVRKRAQIVEKNRRRFVSSHILKRGGSLLTKEQLQKRVEELEQENDDLQDQLDQIYDIVAPGDEQEKHKKDRVTARGRTDGAQRSG